jgi:S1-C subfamily serine protease
VIVTLSDRAIGSAIELALTVEEHAVGEQVPLQLVRAKRTTASATSL